MDEERVENLLNWVEKETKEQREKNGWVVIRSRGLPFHIPLTEEDRERAEGIGALKDGQWLRNRQHPQTTYFFSPIRRLVSLLYYLKNGVEDKHTGEDEWVTEGVWSSEWEYQDF
uniref:Uncharacterized protein n=1 Tax=Chromera velia CCMP2878 TaxID=1169474 RepID=A0A0G4HC57_9ALVE|eukprot:Cvel_26119.t1-p1 / transcript=Cvel_26119.t1 / gene=Cvel_26119 / organism=Chromera_velia_CCMP2878 / gene_product=hypothetical protein / transcript_product=hypothetical protein / location=Cvel_scaffold3056:13093-13434(+) / protein_length=114 / sequence_SO=supercontig / SO=protein_coding / is_pseudo=false